MKPELNRRFQVLGFIRDYVREHDRPPKVAEMVLALDSQSSTTMRGHICRLVLEGLLSYQRGKMDTLEVTDAGWEYMIDHHNLPLDHHKQKRVRVRMTNVKMRDPGLPERIDRVVAKAQLKEAEGMTANSQDAVYYVHRIHSPTGLKAYRIG